MKKSNCDNERNLRKLIIILPQDFNVIFLVQDKAYPFGDLVAFKKAVLVQSC